MQEVGGTSVWDSQLKTYEEAKAFEKAIEGDPFWKGIEFKKCRYTGGTFLNDEGKAGNWEF